MTDVVRLTIECETEEVLLHVLREIAKKKKKGLIWVDRVKNRLRRDKQVVSGGGYQDLQFLARIAENGHVCEIQFNLASFVSIKQDGGHRAYTAARMVAAFEPVTFKYAGNARNMTKLPCNHFFGKMTTGLLQEVTLVANFDMGKRLANCLAKPACALRSLIIIMCAQMEVSMHELLSPTVCSNLSGSLETLIISNCQTGGHVPKCMSELRRLKKVDLSANNLIGEIPRELASLTRMESFWIADNNLVGRLPQDFISEWKNIDSLWVGGSNRIEDDASFRNGWPSATTVVLVGNLLLAGGIEIGHCPVSSQKTIAGGQNHTNFQLSAAKKIGKTSKLPAAFHL